ncbi:ComF family protein [Shimia aestuarii]|uniref:ComF family protein n=1 Tax=Shimia aestuarii TaxID=254406 RepID=UPI001FB43AAB|nr:double zinc ribbon domain-containing protein [Shimia aestuarii]
MLAKFQTALHLLFPPRCVGCGDLVESDFGLCGPCWRETPFAGGLVCEKCGIPVHGQEDQAPVLCDDCLRYERPWSHGRTALLYRDNGRKLVLAIKHGDRYDVVHPAARWLALAAKPLLCKLDDQILIAPVPLHRSRLFKRRFNQSALLARALARSLNKPYCLDLLHRPTVSGNMRGLDHGERFAKMQGSMVVNPKRTGVVRDRTVLIVDDVMTSGATLSAATLAAFDAGARDVQTVTLARVAKND